MPANDGKVRERVATAEEAAKLIDALPAAKGSGALSSDEVLEIRASGETAIALAERFGVSDGLVGKVRRGELYMSPESRPPRSRATAPGGRSRSTRGCAARRSVELSGSTCSGTPTS
jgi:hypothetical protein